MYNYYGEFVLELKFVCAWIKYCSIVMSCIQLGSTNMRSGQDSLSILSHVEMFDNVSLRLRGRGSGVNIIMILSVTKSLCVNNPL